MKTATGIASIVLGLLATSALAAPRPLSDAQMSQIVAGEKFTVIGEISDTMTESGNPPDPLLVNAWGISQGPGTPIWVSDNNSGFTTLYEAPSSNPPANFAKVPLNVMVLDGMADPQNLGSPSGTVFSLPSNGFVVSENGQNVDAVFLFDTEDGTIQGWGEGTGANMFPTHTAIGVDQSASGASFKGLTLVGSGGSNPELFAADFEHDRVDIFNNQFQQTGSFTDPSLPAGYSPFNVQVLNGKVYVAFAVLDPATTESVPGRGLGFVDVFDPQGNKLETLVGNGNGSKLNSPWGLTIAPASFGNKFGGALLVGNFGDGKINAYNPNTGQFIGTLKNTGENSIAIDGLWALFPGSDGSIIFSSGPDNQQHGLVGVIRPSTAAASWAFQSHVVMGH